jgi:NADH dehydrogenase
MIDWMILPFFGGDVVNMNVHKPVGVTTVMYEPGQTIVREGDVGQSLFIVRSGEVEVWQEAANEPARLLATLGAGEHFGEAAVFRRLRRTATVRSKTRVVLLHIRREVALALSESTPEIARNLSTLPGRKAEPHE